MNDNISIRVMLNKIAAIVAIILFVCISEASAQIKPPAISGPEINSTSETPKIPIDTSTKVSTGRHGNPDVLAQYPGGKTELFKYLSSNLDCGSKSPSKDRKMQAIVEFQISEQGKAHSLVFKKSISAECDAAIIKLFDEMPLWKPATSKGVAIPTYYMLPIAIAFKS